MGFRPPDLREDGCAQMAVHVVGDDVQGEQRVGPDLLDQGRTAGDPLPVEIHFPAVAQAFLVLIERFQSHGRLPFPFFSGIIRGVILRFRESGTGQASGNMTTLPFT